MLSTFVRGAAAASALLLSATGAQALTINFADFGNASFSFGYGSLQPSGVTFTPLSGSISNCFGATGFTCRTITGVANGASDLPAMGVNTTGATLNFLTTVDVPTNTLYFHPGSQASGYDAILRFTAPVAGNYRFAGAFSRLDNVPSSGGNNGVIVFGANGTDSIVQTLPNGPQFSGFNFNQTVSLAQGAEVYIGVNNNGNYFNDSTGLSGTISVPEPATWGMMILGFGAVGGAMRTRRRRVRFAAA